MIGVTNLISTFMIFCTQEKQQFHKSKANLRVEHSYSKRYALQLERGNKERVARSREADKHVVNNPDQANRD